MRRGMVLMNCAIFHFSSPRYLKCLRFALSCSSLTPSKDRVYSLIHCFDNIAKSTATMDRDKLAAKQAFTLVAQVSGCEMSEVEAAGMKGREELEEWASWPDMMKRTFRAVSEVSSFNMGSVQTVKPARTLEKSDAYHKLTPTMSGFSCTNDWYNPTYNNEQRVEVVLPILLEIGIILFCMSPVLAPRTRSASFYQVKIILSRVCARVRVGKENARHEEEG